MPEVNSLVQDSERLTVLIFCDGDGEIKGTPYDNAINTLLKQNQSALSKANQTFIVVLRSQSGPVHWLHREFLGCGGEFT